MWNLDFFVSLLLALNDFYAVAMKSGSTLCFLGDLLCKNLLAQVAVHT